MGINQRRGTEHLHDLSNHRSRLPIGKHLSLCSPVDDAHAVSLLHFFEHKLRPNPAGSEADRGRRALVPFDAFIRAFRGVCFATGAQVASLVRAKPTGLSADAIVSRGMLT
jgi:hypothetical protein